MTKAEGIVFWQECLKECGLDYDAENPFFFCYGNKKDLSAYQTGVVKAKVGEDEIQLKKYVIKSLIHQNMFVIWSARNHSWNYEYAVFANQLIDSKNEPSKIHELNTVNNGQAFVLSLDKSLGIEFIKKHVIDEGKDNVQICN